jgi:hypothetical protein
VRSAEAVRLDETPLVATTVELDGDRVRVPVTPFALASIRLVP